MMSWIHLKCVLHWNKRWVHKNTKYFLLISKCLCLGLASLIASMTALSIYLSGTSSCSVALRADHHSRVVTFVSQFWILDSDLYNFLSCFPVFIISNFDKDFTDYDYLYLSDRHRVEDLKPMNANGYFTIDKTTLTSMVLVRWGT